MSAERVICDNELQKYFTVISLKSKYYIKLSIKKYTI